MLHITKEVIKAKCAAYGGGKRFSMLELRLQFN